MASMSQLVNGKVNTPASAPVSVQPAQPEMTREQMLAEIERLRNSNAELAKKKERQVTLKVSEKGAVSLYGLGRFPITLYKEQWNAVLNLAEDIKSFIQENENLLSEKKKD